MRCSVTLYYVVDSSSADLTTSVVGVAYITNVHYIGPKRIYPKNLLFMQSAVLKTECQNNSRIPGFQKNYSTHNPLSTYLIHNMLTMRIWPPPLSPSAQFP